MALPSWKRASGRSVNVTQERSAGTSTLSAINPYSEEGSSDEATVSVSKSWPAPAAGTPLRMKGLRLSKVPIAASRTSPPLGASGFAYSKCLKPGPYLRSPWIDRPWPVVARGSAPCTPTTGASASATASPRSAAVNRNALDRSAMTSALAEHLDQDLPAERSARHLARKGDAAAVQARAAPEPELEAEPVHPHHPRLLGLLAREHPREGQERVAVIAVHVLEDAGGGVRQGIRSRRRVVKHREPVHGA